MVTPLDRPLRRAVLVDGEPYVVTIDNHGVRIVPKGRRKGHEVAWRDILSGDVTLQAQLVESLARSAQDRDTPARAVGGASDPFDHSAM